MIDLLVLGAGAAGLMAAGRAAQLGLRVCLVEKNSRPGRKLAITGKGRCNVTNACSVPAFIASVPSNGRFLHSALSRFSPEDTMAFFESLGLALKVERGNRVFPVSDRAQDAVDTLAGFVQQNGAQLILGEAQSLWLEDGAVCGAVLKDGTRLEAAQVLVACGGVSYPGTGSTGDSFRFARQAGHTVTALRPSLVPLVAQGNDCRTMMGLSLRNVAVRVWDTKTGKEIFQDFGELLFTHFGLSGPIVLSASAHLRQMEPGRYRLEIDFKPGLTLEKLDQRLQRDFLENQNRDFINSLHDLLPRKAIPVLVRRSNIAPGTKCNAVTREQRRSFAQLLKRFAVAIEGFRPIEEAIVTAGGVAVKEIDPRTMKSKLVQGLSFAGEALDLDAYTGGYNLQIAFSTGRLAAESAAQELHPSV